MGVDNDDREQETPVGREAVMAALVAATIELIVDSGLRVSVRQIAAQAGVNHGLVHRYFGSKRALMRAALDDINRRGVEESDDAGFPPPDLGSRRGGELSKAVARIRLEAGSDLFSNHPVAVQWAAAIKNSRPELSRDEIDLMIARASAVGLGWGIFGDHLAEFLGYEGERRAALDANIARLVAELGGMPLD